MTHNPPPLVSPVPGLEIHAVLDRDATMTAGLAVERPGRRVLVLVGIPVAAPGERREFFDWVLALEEVGRVAPIAEIIDFGHTADQRPFFATRVLPTLADRMRLVGPPSHRAIGIIATTIADVLAASHAAGIVHGAVNPAAIQLDGESASLGGFGATAPGLDAALGVWAFTPPEHRAAAAAGRPVGSPAADVFGLAATICVARAGMLPWSDPVSWADAAGLPAGPAAWVTAIRAALDPDPDGRPTAEEFASSMRSAPEADGTAGARVDLRGLIPRQVRRLAAYSLDAMADAGAVSAGRAAPPQSGDWSDSSDAGAPQGSRATGKSAAASNRSRWPWRGGVGGRRASTAGPGPGAAAASHAAEFTAAESTAASASVDVVGSTEADTPIGLGHAIRTRPAVVGIAAAATAVLLGTGAYAWAQHGPPPAPGQTVSPVTTTSPDPIASPDRPPVPTLSPAQFLAGARSAGQIFIRAVGAGHANACANVIGGAVVNPPSDGAPISCADFVKQAHSLLGTKALKAMSHATVAHATSTAGTPPPGGPGLPPYPQATIALKDVPALQPAFNRFELVLTFRAGHWWVAEVTFA